MSPQAGVGTDQMAVTTIEVDDATNSILNMKWQLIPINDRLAEPDHQIGGVHPVLQEQRRPQVQHVLSKFTQMLTHPNARL